MKKAGSHIYFLVLLIAAVTLFSTFYFQEKTFQDSDMITGFASSQVGNLSATVSTYLACTWSNAALNITFNGTLNPGDTDQNATQNYNFSTPATNGSSYNVTVDSLSNVQANITVLGASLTSGANILGVGNVTWDSNTTDSNSTLMAASGSIVLTTSYDTVNKVASNEPIGSTVWFRFWLDIPTVQLAGSYVGNYTMSCDQA